jgi:NADH-quinone oxidoreductase subunit N
MSAPIIWIGLPIIVAIVLWFFRKNEKTSLITGLASSLFFTITAIITPVGKPLLQVGTFVIQIETSVSILGRSFTLTNGDLIFVALIFLILFLFLCMSFIIEIPDKFLPIGFLFTGLILGALSVQPFLYAALILELCVLLSLMLMSPQGQIPSTGAMRFLIFQSLAMPFMLAAGWVLSAVEANPTETRLVLQALGLIGLGFSFWLAVFPFNFWMPQLAGEKPPFIVGFILIIFNTATLILVMRYLDGFVWLRDDARIFVVLRFLGILMLFSSAVFFLFEKNKYRTTAYLISFETGISLLALSLNQTIGWNIFVLMLLPRILSLSLWIATLAYIQQNEPVDGNLDEIVIHPLLVGSFVVSGLSIAGFPLLPGFSNRVAIYGLLANMDLIGFIWIGIANIIFMMAVFNFIGRLLTEYNIDKHVIISRIEKGFLVFYISIIGLIGIFPQFFMGGILIMLQAFPNLK